MCTALNFIILYNDIQGYSQHYSQIQTLQFLQKLDEQYTKIESIDENNNTTLNYFNDQNQNIMRVTLDNQKNIKESVEFYTDGALSKTSYKTNQTKTKKIFNKDKKLIKIAHTNQYNQSKTVDKTTITAWHEAGHAVSYIHLHPSYKIKHVTIEPNALHNSDGHVKYFMHSTDQTIEELENHIISALCGGIAEQIVIGQNMLTDHHEILEYFAQSQFKSDIKAARQYAHEIIQKSISYTPAGQCNEKIDKIIVQLYKTAYQFIYHHELQVKRIADQLLQKTTLHDYTPYDIIYAPRPTW